MGSLAAILLLSISIILVIIPFTAPVSASTSTTSINVEKWVKYKNEPDTEYRKIINDAKVSDTVTFKIAIYNNGSTSLTNIWVWDRNLSCNLRYSEGSASIPPTYYENYCLFYHYQELWWEFPALWLEPGEFLNITFDADVEECGGGVNDVCVEAEDATGEYVYDEDTVWVTCEVEDKPDLEIVDKWEKWVDENHYNVTYVIHNSGTATAPAGHNTTLYVDGIPTEYKHVPVVLEPCETYEDTFDTVIKCTDESDTIKVCADNDEVVDELNENNNCLSNELECQHPLWHEINKELDSLKGNVSNATMPNIIKHRLVDKLEYAKELKENAKIEYEAGNVEAATKKLGVAKNQVESFESMVKITRRISPEDKEIFLADAAEIIERIDRLIETL